MSFKPHQTQTSLAEINVTPLLDVMLVLLIVFMISAPMLQQGVSVDLPKANTGAIQETPDQVVISIQTNRKISIDGKPIEPGTLRQRLETLVRQNPALEAVVFADQKIPYGLVAEVIAEAKQARLSKVGLATAPGDPKKRL